MCKPTTVVRLDRAADEHQRRLGSEEPSGVRGQRSETVSLDQDQVVLFPRSYKLVEDKARERYTPNWPQARGDFNGWRLAYLDASFDLSRDQLQVEVFRQSFHQANVCTALDDEQQSSFHAEHREKMESSWSM
jgi:hypothetical protein